MNAGMLGFFSGFPDRRFPDGIAERLRTELTDRESLTFVSAWPEDGRRNDEDAAGMHRMFAERGMGFARFGVIDARTEAAEARRMIREASCVFLMGGHATNQMRMIREKGIADEIRENRGVILGVSAGAMNMGKRCVDVWESPEPYDGLGLADLTVKAHFGTEEDGLAQTLRRISMELPVCAMEDESAVFIKADGTACAGALHWIDRGTVLPFSPEILTRRGSAETEILLRQAEDILKAEPWYTAAMSNLSALLAESLPDLNWAGFYLLRDGRLVVGPFQGKPACIHIPVGKGVCGTAAAQNRMQVVPDVHAFPGHIACDSASASEIVIPIRGDGEIRAVLDIDSPVPNRFGAADAAALADFVRTTEKHISWE